MHSLSVLKWHVNLDNMSGLSQRKKIFMCECLNRRQCSRSHFTEFSCHVENKHGIIFVFDFIFWTPDRR